MDIYLVRHGIAGERDPERWPDDSLRPLTKKGIRRFERAASGLVSLVPDVDAVLSSPYKRAWQTASILEDAGWPSPLRFDALVRGEPGSLIGALQPYSELDAIALVGHEPHISRFAASLLGRAPWDELKKGGVVKLSLPHLSLSGGATLVWYLPPRVLRRLR
ncbi:MAG: histidine phosphatase family protein [Dehalococcoidia bacterium]